jgi:hypothetical protein
MRKDCGAETVLLPIPDDERVRTKLSLIASLDPHYQIRWSFTHFVQCTENSEHQVKLHDVEEEEIEHLWSHEFSLSPTMIAALTEKGYLDEEGNLGIPCSVSVRTSTHLAKCRV